MPFNRFVLIVFLLLITGNKSFAQAGIDTSLNTAVISDSLADKKAAELEERTRVVTVPEVAENAQIPKPKVFQPNPKKSALFSAILPGTGQIYNRQYWKAGLVYAGIGVAGYFLIDNTKEYRKYRKAYVSRLSNPNYKDEFTGLYAESQMQSVLQQRQDTYKKWLDMTYLYTAVGYILQVMDALAFAHLRNFDISKDLSMRMQPVAMPDNGVGIGLVVRWNK